MDYLYDTHYHLDLQKDRSAAIREIEEKQIYTISFTNLPDLYQKESVEVASKYIRFALGFHPELIHQYKSQISLMWDLLPEVRYIGEVGLDYVDITFKKEQVEFFTELIERCRNDEKKILTIHSRKAVNDVLHLLYRSAELFGKGLGGNHLVSYVRPQEAYDIYSILIGKSAEEPHHICRIAEGGIHAVLRYLQKAEVPEVGAESRDSEFPV